MREILWLNRIGGTLQQQFLAAHAESGISPKEWCESQRLNYATARRYIKKPAAQSAQKSLYVISQYQLRRVENKIVRMMMKNTFDVRNYGLSDLQAKFVNEYLIDLNRTAAYKRASGKVEVILHMLVPAGCTEMLRPIAQLQTH